MQLTTQHTQEAVRRFGGAHMLVIGGIVLALAVAMGIAVSSGIRSTGTPGDTVDAVAVTVSPSMPALYEEAGGGVGTRVVVPPSLPALYDAVAGGPRAAHPGLTELEVAAIWWQADPGAAGTSEAPATGASAYSLDPPLHMLIEQYEALAPGAAASYPLDPPFHRLLEMYEALR